MISSSQLPDARLIVAMRGGSEEAAAVLVRRHWRSCWRAARSITGRADGAEDIVQDAFESAFRHIQDFDIGRPFAPWLHRIVVNRAIDVVRKDRSEAHPLSEDLVDESRGGGGGEAGLIEGLAELSEERRAVVVMRYLLGYNPTEISELLELPVGTVYSRLSRGLQELRTILEAE